MTMTTTMIMTTITTKPIPDSASSAGRLPGTFCFCYLLSACCNPHYQATLPINLWYHFM